MSAASLLLCDFHRRGITLIPDGTLIRYRAPRDVITSEDLAAVREHKSEIMRLLAPDAVPADWIVGVAKLDPERPPGDVPPGHWRRFIENCQTFLVSGWAARAAALGWDALDLFGADNHKPYARFDHAGLLWMVGGKSLIELSAESAIIETARAGVRLTFRLAANRSRSEIGLAWDLAA
jgi:hypothetical protein